LRNYLGCLAWDDVLLGRRGGREDEEREEMEERGWEDG